MWRLFGGFVFQLQFPNTFQLDLISMGGGRGERIKNSSSFLSTVS
jgi:hypothetical protein